MILWRLEGRGRWHWSRSPSRSRRCDGLQLVRAATCSRSRKEGDGGARTHVQRCAFRRFICLTSRRLQLRWRSRCDMRVGDRTRLRACLECLCAHCCCHTLSILFLPCRAQIFSATSSAECLQTALDKLASVAQSPCRVRRLARRVATASFPGPSTAGSACFIVWHSSMCVRRTSRRSPERLAKPTVGLGQTWDKETQDCVHRTETRGPDAYGPTFLVLHPHRALQGGSA